MISEEHRAHCDINTATMSSKNVENDNNTNVPDTNSPPSSSSEDGFTPDGSQFTWGLTRGLLQPVQGL